MSSSVALLVPAALQVGPCSVVMLDEMSTGLVGYRGGKREGAVKGVSEE